ncbi:MAG: gluconate 2-dehydrogenase subunit 3 family protein [Actinomycetes bacterium]
MGWLSETERGTLTAIVDRLIPPGADAASEPGAAHVGVVDYIDALLDAFSVVPPRIFAGGPSSGRFGGEAAYEPFLPLTRVQEIAWRERISGWQRIYRDGLAALGPDFLTLAPDQQEARFAAEQDLAALVYEHTCEGYYAAPEYGGNRELAGWRLANWSGDVAPRGWTAEEVTSPQ